MKTYSPKAKELDTRWLLVDAENQTLGRLASKVAQLIRGKHKPTFAPHLDCGDNVVVINAAKVRLTGRKLEQKRYFRYSGYVGNEKFVPVSTMLQRHPERVIEHAVFGMLPKGTLGRQTLRRKLRVYPGSDHPHAGQTPEQVEL